MWDINRWSVSPPRPPLLASDTVGMEMLGMVNTLDTVANGDWVLVAESMTSCLMMAVCASFAGSGLVSPLSDSVTVPSSLESPSMLSPR